MTALRIVGLADRSKHYPRQLSGGQEQRVAIARAVVSRPAILIADEPTGNLDESYAAEIMQLFLSFHQVGVTVIIATHNASALASSTAKILRLDHGGILA